jgi:hypothetical protein
MRVFIIVFFLLLAASVSAQNLSSQDSLKIIIPNGGEKFLIGSDTVITWTGIPLTDTVKLEYSTDAGTSWHFITDTATGGRYPWHVPGTVSDSCLVRVGEVHFLHSKSNGWVKEHLGGINYYYDACVIPTGNSIAMDTSGNIYVIGSSNFVYAKYSSYGNLISTTPGNACADKGIAIDGIGNIYVTWRQHINSLGVYGDMFVEKYHTDGKREWSKRIANNKFTNYAEGRGIAVDKLGSVYVTGIYKGSMNFGSFSLTSAKENIFLMKYHPDGSVEWAQSICDTNYDAERMSTGITIDLYGDIIITGALNGSTKGSELKVSGISLLGGILVAKYHSNGSISWAKSTDGGTAQITTGYGWYLAGGNNIATDSMGNIFVAGAYHNIAHFDAITIIDTGGNPGSTFFVAKYSPDGNVEWVNSPNRDKGEGFFYDEGVGISIDFKGNVLVTGTFNGNLDFGVDKLYSNDKNIFVSKYRNDGGIIWAKQTSGSGSRYNAGYGIISDKNGNIYVTGCFFSTLMFEQDTLSSASNQNLFIWKIDKDDTLHSEISDRLFSIINPKNLVTIPVEQMITVHINPNPANGIIHIEIQTIETGRMRLELMNLLGMKVVSISDGELKPGLHSFDLNTHDLSAGSYFLTLATPTVRRMERVDIEK